MSFGTNLWNLRELVKTGWEVLGIMGYRLGFCHFELPDVGCEARVKSK